jgi:3-hydroxyacyl-[acyl-carrier-protein] dehydratase
MPPELNFDVTNLDFGRVLADKEAIRRVNPQRFEFEQLDAIVFIDPTLHLVIGYKDVRADEFWVRGHLPDYPLLPGVLMCEAAAQLCSYYIRSQNLIGGAFMGFGGLENVRFRSPVFPGDRLVLVAKALKVHRRQTLCNVQGFVKSSMVFHGDILGVSLPRKGEG